MYSTHKVEAPSKTQLGKYKRGPEQFCCLGCCLSIAGGGPTVVLVLVCRASVLLHKTDDGRLVVVAPCFCPGWTTGPTLPKNNDVYPKKSSSPLLFPTKSALLLLFRFWSSPPPPFSLRLRRYIILTRAGISSYFSHSAQRMKSKTTPGNRIRVSWSSFRRMYTLVPVFRRRGYSFSKLSGREGIRFLMGFSAQ